MHFRRQRAALLTLQERKTRITLGGRLASKRAEPTRDQIVAKLAVLPKHARRAATFDDGELNDRRAVNWWIHVSRATPS